MFTINLVDKLRSIDHPYFQFNEYNIYSAHFGLELQL